MQVGTFDTRLPQASTEKRRDMGIKGRGDIEDEQQQTFYSFDNTLSSVKLFIEIITASSTFATPSLIVPTHTQLSAPSVLVGTPVKSPTPSFSATDSYLLLLKSLERIHESDVESTGIGADEVAVGEVVIPNGMAVVGELTVFGMCTTADLGE
ncbi:uncharacterized protein MONOS_15986 [Monocercomonoides exilis]|uniref:uncharacterized protein n=1 Tax=Monocercomonoides exilis TaxID=2049356 RepID=UPI003559A5E0|nr:hypothetical protein MONOS_15986 [Monocercomonoides exilis]|eukprot:MONOS_15986.1-p1 / transcript=MONOS_15986.1 / gene=MONOS_15986 / organism=Monocercomonoides_exilis_PA203 / gene_product=unspecified product / transcript_product=unspecified product / location=Mono_scaffold01446:3621-4274(+) / protein_length=153 / sequence_SO=supercontig / SO=protein_coding / is_pseudo=false